MSQLEPTKKKTPDISGVTSAAKISEKYKLPTLSELHSGNLQLAGRAEELNALLNAQPKPEWIREHPFIKGHKYLPIAVIEFLLRSIFKRYSVEVTGQGTAFNGVWVTVRIHYYNPASMAMEFVDGIGASQLQTAKGTSPADLANINNGAISMAFPLAKTLAVKDAAGSLGKIFGADIDRKDTIQHTVDVDTIDRYKKAIE